MPEAPPDDAAPDHLIGRNRLLLERVKALSEETRHLRAEYVQLQIRALELLPLIRGNRRDFWKRQRRALGL